MDPQDSMNKKPLYRKKNKILHNGWSSYHFPRARYRFERHSKKVEAAVDHLPVKRYQKYHRTGYDYTPLIRFLHAHVGQAWDPVFRRPSSMPTAIIQVPLCLYIPCPTL